MIGINKYYLQIDCKENSVKNLKPTFKSYAMVKFVIGIHMGTSSLEFQWHPV